MRGSQIWRVWHPDLRRRLRLEMQKIKKSERQFASTKIYPVVLKPVEKVTKPRNVKKVKGSIYKDQWMDDVKSLLVVYTCYIAEHAASGKSLSNVGLPLEY